MIPLPLSEVADAVGGRVHGGPGADRVVVDGPVVTDSRTAGPGSLYVARIGEVADGHAYVADAAARGAVAALVTALVTAPGTGPDCGSATGPADDLPCVVLDPDQPGGDVAAAALQPADRALGQLARTVLDRLADVAVVGVTGSVGKTSTKDLLAQVLATAGPTVAAQGSYNGEVGVPLTVLRAGTDTRFLVVEMGARGVGHIRHLTTIAPPRVGVVLNVGSAHLGEFGSREAIARAKGELVEALGEGGTAVLNADDPVVAAMAGRVGPGVRVRTVGQSAGADVRAVDVSLDDAARASFTLAADGAAAPVSLRLYGEHQVATALSAAGRRSRSDCRSPTSPPRCPRRPRAAGGAWRSPSAPTGSPSSTTPTTPTRSRCARR